MFDHSIKVPRLYKTAAKILQEVQQELASVKQLVYQKKHPNIKALYALIVETRQRENEINKLLKRSQLLEKESRFDPWLARILITELLWGKKRLAGECKPVKTILAYEQILKAHVNDVESSNNNATTTNKVEKPRYVRVNTLYTTLNEAIEKFQNEDWTLSKFSNKTNYKEYINKISSLEQNEFVIDIHIPNLLVFPPRSEFYNHKAYKSGAILLQDKASCLPVHILNPPSGSVVLDMCAAPGMKTTQVAAVLNNEGTVFAFERDERRFIILNDMVEKSGATCVQTINKDVLASNAKTCPNVEYILVDPSCSGTGMTDRLEFEAKESQLRISKLQGFQIKILRHALTKFPDAKRVVYSTCSVLPDENEDVVRQVLETNNLFKLVPAKQYVNDIWCNFGSSDFGQLGEFCLYAKPQEDLTNGFFVAVFERLEEGEKNQFFNERIFNYKKKIELKKLKSMEKELDSNEKIGKRKKNNKKKQLDEDINTDVEKPKHLQNEVDEIEIKSKKKKKSLVDIEEIENVENNSNAEKKLLKGAKDTEEDLEKKKKKLKSNRESYEESNKNHVETESNVDRKKKRKHKEIELNTENMEELEKKKDHKESMDPQIEPTKKKHLQNEVEINSKKTKSRVGIEEVDNLGNNLNAEKKLYNDAKGTEEDLKKKKKNRKSNRESYEESNKNDHIETEFNLDGKKKRKHKEIELNTENFGELKTKKDNKENEKESMDREIKPMKKKHLQNEVNEVEIKPKKKKKNHVDIEEVENGNAEKKLLKDTEDDLKKKKKKSKSNRESCEEYHIETDSNLDGKKKRKHREIELNTENMEELKKKKDRKENEKESMDPQIERIEKKHKKRNKEDGDILDEQEGNTELKKSKKKNKTTTE